MFFMYYKYFLKKARVEINGCISLDPVHKSTPPLPLFTGKNSLPKMIKSCPYKT